MSYTVLLPARLASTRLPNKPLADIGGAPMIVRVAQRAALSAARAVVVAADAKSIATITGGTYLHANNESELIAAFEKLARTLPVVLTD